MLPDITLNREPISYYATMWGILLCCRSGHFNYNTVLTDTRLFADLEGVDRNRGVINRDVKNRGVRNRGVRNRG